MIFYGTQPPRNTLASLAHRFFYSFFSFSSPTAPRALTESNFHVLATSREIPRAGKRYDFRGNDPEDFREPTHVSYHLVFFCQRFFFDTRFYKIPSRFISFDFADVDKEKN